MSITEHLKFSVRGFSPKRMAYLLDLMSVGFLPVHTFVSCEQSGGIAGFAFIDLLAVLVLCLFAPRSDSHRFSPFVLGFFILVFHSLFSH